MLKHTQFRYCPKCAQDALSLLDENGCICRACGMKYYHNTASAVGALIATDQGMLILERAHDPKAGMFDIPGGFVNYNESLEEALCRELYEELNISIGTYRYMGSFPNVYNYADITYFTTDVIFIVDWNTNFEITPNDEVSKIHYIDKHHINIDKFGFESTKKALKMYQSLR